MFGFVVECPVFWPAVEGGGRVEFTTKREGWVVERERWDCPEGWVTGLAKTRSRG